MFYQSGKNRPRGLKTRDGIEHLQHNSYLGNVGFSPACAYIEDMFNQNISAYRRPQKLMIKHPAMLLTFLWKMGLVCPPKPFCLWSYRRLPCKQGQPTGEGQRKNITILSTIADILPDGTCAVRQGTSFLVPSRYFAKQQEEDIEVFGKVP